MKIFNFYSALITLLFAIIFLNGCSRKEFTPPSKTVTPKDLYSLVDQSLKDSVLVSTPFGPRLRSDVHIIAAGHKVVHVGKDIQEVDASTGKLIRDFGIPVPLKYLKATNAAAKLSGSVPANNPTNTTGLIRTLTDGGTTNPGWKTWAQSTTTAAKGPVSSAQNFAFSGQWVVPPLPGNINDGQIIYIFVGAQDTEEENIVQPVLEFGETSSGGGNYWSITSAYAGAGSNSYVMATQAVKVNPGDLLAGGITITNNNGPNANYGFICNFSVTPYGTNSTTQEPGIMGDLPDAFAELYATLEDYGVKVDSDYPSSNYVAMNQLYASGFTAVTNNPYATNNEHTVIINPTSYAQAYIYFRAAPLPVPVISYPTPNSFVQNIAITSLSPTNTGTTPTSYSISPTLPAGLSFNTSTGVISGTATVASPATSYTVTATNSVGSGTFIVNISVLATASVVYQSYAIGGGINNLTFVGGPQNTTYSFTTGTTPLPWGVPPGTYKVTITPVGQKYGMYDNGKGYTNVVFEDGSLGYCFGYTGGNFTFNWTVKGGDTLDFLVYNNNTCPFN